MKFVVSNDQVLHLFANHGQPRANNANGSLSFESMTVWLGKTGRTAFRVMVLHSYRTAIAFYAVDNPDVIYYAGGGGYSVTTSGHVSSLWSAARHKALVCVPGAQWGDGGHTWIKGLKSKREFRTSLAQSYARRHHEIRSAKRPRPAQAAQLESDLERDSKAFESLHGEPLGIVLDAALLEKANAWHAEKVRREARERARREEDARRAAQERAEELAKDLPKWRAGEIGGRDLPYHETTFLRLIEDGKTVQTSHGAEVPLSLAIAFYERFRAGNAQFGQHVGPYKFTHEENGVLNIGCHRIPVSEMEALYKTLPVEA